MTNTVQTKVITGKGRLSYAYIWNPREQDGQEPKYSTSFLIPKTDKATVQKINAAIEAAKELGRSKKWGGKIPSNLKLPLRDGDTEATDKGDEYRGHWFINANSKDAPGVVDAQCNPIIDKAEVYSGCYARISISFFPYDTNGNRGIGIGLNHVQKLADGEPLGGARGRAENEFDAWDEDDEALGF